MRAEGQVRAGVVRDPCAPSPVKSRTTVSGCGATGAPSALRLAPAAASTSCGAGCTQAVTSSTAVFPHSTAAVHSASTHGRPCRTPRGSRGSGTAAKHSSRFPPDAAASAAAREPALPALFQRQQARACETERATGPPGMEKRCEQSLVLAGTPLPSPQRHAQRPQRDATGTNPAALAVTVRGRLPQQTAPRTCPARYGK